MLPLLLCASAVMYAVMHAVHAAAPSRLVVVVVVVIVIVVLEEGVVVILILAVVLVLIMVVPCRRLVLVAPSRRWLRAVGACGDGFPVAVVGVASVVVLVLTLMWGSGGRPGVLGLLGRMRWVGIGVILVHLLRCGLRRGNVPSRWRLHGGSWW